MATSTLNFAAQVDAWCRETEDRLERVWKQSSQELASVASAGVPIDLGFANASIQASTEAMPQINPSATNKEKQPASLNFSEITATINNAKLGGTIYIGWTAAYILPLEYGHSKQAPQGFARLAAEQWPVIVSGVIAQAKARAA